MDTTALVEDFDHCRKTSSQNTIWRAAFCRASFSTTSVDGCFYKITDNLIDDK